MQHFDVIVVGAGPAGGMAAWELGRAGARTLVLEAMTLPRPKPCGGALSPGVTKIYPGDLPGQIESQPTRIKSLMNFSQEKNWRTNSIRFVDRARFDAYLVQQALNFGSHVILRDGCAVRSAEEQADGVTLVTDSGERVKARYLVAADGPTSRVARSLGLGGKRLLGAAMDAEVDVIDAAFERECGHATFNYFCIKNGYGWIFPKKDGRLTCGVGSWRARHRVAQSMNQFLERSFHPSEILSCSIRGHAIPLYVREQVIFSQRVCLAGDAANLVDPIMGEGIRFALHSGALAGREIVAQLSSPTAAGLRGYQEAVRMAFAGQLLHLAQFIMPIFLQAPDTFYREFIVKGKSYSSLAARLGQAFSVSKARHQAGTENLRP